MLTIKMEDEFLKVGDVNGDHLDDFYVGGALNQAGVLYIQNTDGDFVKTNTELWEVDKNKEDMGALFFDFDSDGDKDLYVVSGGNEKNISVENFQDRLYINNGEGKFSKGKNILPKIESSGSRVIEGDYDNDGDLVLIN